MAILYPVGTFYVRAVDSNGNPVSGAMVSWSYISNADVSREIKTTDSRGLAYISFESITIDGDIILPPTYVDCTVTKLGYSNSPCSVLNILQSNNNDSSSLPNNRGTAYLGINGTHITSYKIGTTGSGSICVGTSSTSIPTTTTPTVIAKNTNVYIKINANSGYEPYALSAHISSINGTVIGITNIGGTYNDGYFNTGTNTLVCVTYQFRSSSTYTITTNLTSGGSIEIGRGCIGGIIGLPTTTAKQYDTLYVKFIPNPGFKLGSIDVTGSLLLKPIPDPGTNIYTFSMPAQNTTIYAEFIPEWYTDSEGWRRLDEVSEDRAIISYEQLTIPDGWTGFIDFESSTEYMYDGIFLSTSIPSNWEGNFEEIDTSQFFGSIEKEAYEIYDCECCGTCLSMCPVDAITVSDDPHYLIDPIVCVGCGRCADVCPLCGIEPYTYIDIGNIYLTGTGSLTITDVPAGTYYVTYRCDGDSHDNNQYVRYKYRLRESWYGDGGESGRCHDFGNTTQSAYIDYEKIELETNKFYEIYIESYYDSENDPYTGIFISSNIPQQWSGTFSDIPSSNLYNSDSWCTVGGKYIVVSGATCNTLYIAFRTNGYKKGQNGNVEYIIQSITSSGSWVQNNTLKEVGGTNKYYICNISSTSSINIQSSYIRNNSGTVIVELYDYDNGSGSNVKTALYYSGVCQKNELNYTFANLSNCWASCTSSVPDKKVFLIHNKYNSSYERVSFFGSGPATYSMGAYGTSTGANCNVWDTFTSSDGKVYYSITVNSYSVNPITSFQAKAGYTYTFNIHTYSEATYDGIIISDVEYMVKDSPNVIYFDDGFREVFTGLNNTSTCTYTSTSTKTIYISFWSDYSVLGDKWEEEDYDSIQGQISYEVEDGYECGDIEITITPPNKTVSFYGGDNINYTYFGNIYSSSNPYTITRKSNEKIYLPKVTYSDGTNTYISECWTNGSSKYDIGDLYTIEDLPSTLTASWRCLNWYTVSSNSRRRFDGGGDSYYCFEADEFTIPTGYHGTIKLWSSTEDEFDGIVILPPSSYNDFKDFLVGINDFVENGEGNEYLYSSDSYATGFGTNSYREITNVPTGTYYAVYLRDGSGYDGENYVEYKLDLIPNNYTLTFHPGDGLLDSNGCWSTNHDTSNNASLNVPFMTTTANSAIGICVKTGYSFKGWYTASTGGTQVYNAYGMGITGTYWNSSSKWIYANNLDLYAQYEINTYNVSMDHWCWGWKNGEGNNGNSKTTYHLCYTSKTATYGSTVNMSSSDNVEALNGFYPGTSIGCSDLSGSWTVYTLPFDFTMPAKNVSFEYDWYLTNYTITYNLNGGTLGSGSPTTYDVIYGATLVNPTKTGHTFDGWYENYNNGVYSNKVTGYNTTALSFSNATELRTALNSRTTGNKTLYAKWNVNTYTVNAYVYKYDEGEGYYVWYNVLSRSFSYGTNISSTLSSLVSSNYECLVKTVNINNNIIDIRYSPKRTWTTTYYEPGDSQPSSTSTVVTGNMSFYSLYNTETLGWDYDYDDENYRIYNGYEGREFIISSESITVGPGQIGYLILESKTEEDYDGIFMSTNNPDNPDNNWDGNFDNNVNTLYSSDSYITGVGEYQEEDEENGYYDYAQKVIYNIPSGTYYISYRRDRSVNAYGNSVRYLFSTAPTWTEETISGKTYRCIYNNDSPEFLTYETITIPQHYKGSVTFRTYTEGGYDGIFLSTTTPLRWSGNFSQIGSTNTLYSSDSYLSGYDDYEDDYTYKEKVINNIPPGTYYVAYRRDYSESEGDDYVKYNLTLVPDTYTVTFHPEGGTLVSSNQTEEVNGNWGSNYNTTNNGSITATYGTGSYCLMGIAYKQRYTFTGWYTASSGGTQVYDANGECVTGSYWTSGGSWKYTNNLDLYAQYTPNTVTKPVVVNNLVYNGTLQMGISGYDASEMDIVSGDITATNAGNYFVVISVDGNSMWSDGTTNNITLNWSIAKAESRLPTTWQGDADYYHMEAVLTASGYVGGSLKYRYDVNNGTIWTETETAPTRTDVGSTSVQCKVIGDSNHNDSSWSTTVTLTIYPTTDAYTTVTINSSTLTYNGNVHNIASVETHGCTAYLGFGSSSTVAPTSWFSANERATATNAGTYYVWYKFTPDSNHSNSNTGTYVGSKEIEKHSQTLTISPTTKTIYSTDSGSYGYNSFTITPSNNQGTLTFSSSDTSVATVSNLGVVIYVGPGSATITVTSSGNENYSSGSQTCSVTCIKDTVKQTIQDSCTYGTPYVIYMGSDSISAGGGLVKFSSSVTDTLYFHYIWTSGHTESVGYRTNEVSGSVGFSITSSSGEWNLQNDDVYDRRLIHGDMKRTEKTDTCTVVAYNVNSISNRVTVNTWSVSNELDNTTRYSSTGYPYTKGYNTSYGTPSKPTVSNNTNTNWCSGGSGTLSSSVTNTISYYYRYTSGCFTDLQSESVSGTVTFVKTSDTGNWFTGQGNNWILSGSTISHRDMETSWVTDYCKVVAKNAKDTSKVSSELTLTASNTRTLNSTEYRITNLWKEENSVGGVDFKGFKFTSNGTTNTVYGNQTGTVSSSWLNSHRGETLCFSYVLHRPKEGNSGSSSWGYNRYGIHWCCKVNGSEVYPMTNLLLKTGEHKLVYTTWTIPSTGTLTDLTWSNVQGGYPEYAYPNSGTEWSISDVMLELASSPSRLINASGGSVKIYCTGEHDDNYTYVSGSNGTSTTQDTCTLTVTNSSDGISSLSSSSSGATLTHTSMGTDCRTDYIKITGTNNGVSRDMDLYITNSLTGILLTLEKNPIDFNETTTTTVTASYTSGSTQTVDATITSSDTNVAIITS